MQRQSLTASGVRRAAVNARSVMNFTECIGLLHLLCVRHEKLHPLTHRLIAGGTEQTILLRTLARHLNLLSQNPFHILFPILSKYKINCALARPVRSALANHGLLHHPKQTHLPQPQRLSQRAPLMRIRQQHTEQGAFVEPNQACCTTVAWFT